MNAWGLAASATGPWWVANEARSSSTLYDAGGRKLSVDVDYTNSSGSVTTNGSPQTFNYFADDRLSGSGGRGGGTQNYSYDPAGDMLSGTDNSGAEGSDTPGRWH